MFLLLRVIEKLAAFLGKFFQLGKKNQNIKIQSIF